MNLEKIITDLEKKNPGEVEFLQAVREVLESIEDYVNENPYLETANIIDRITEPDHVHMFKVPWMADDNTVKVNRGYRIQFNDALGPYKGGLRFHPSVTLSILKFLGFEQIFKNSLTGLPLGGGKGGSDFDPKGKSDGEIMRFCQSFMIEMWRIVGAESDVPAGDIGVGGKEIGYLYGMYKRLAKEHTGVLTGKGASWGGSLIRPEATGYGGIYYLQEMLKQQNQDLKGKTVSLSGFGNVTWGAAQKLEELGAKVVTISGPDGYVYDPDGITGRKVEYLLELRATNEDIVIPYSYEFQGAEFHEGEKPWGVKCDIAIPCATQNELDEKDAEKLAKNGCTMVVELSNMGCTPEAIEILHENKIFYAPGKAANAGGVAVSGLEMSQNAMKLKWKAEEVDERLHQIMANIHENCMKYGKEDDGFINYAKGANVAGFMKVANTMIDYGIV